MDPDDIPTAITKLVYTAPGPACSQNQAAEFLAHFWTEIERHVRDRVAADIEAAADRVFAEHDEPAMKARGLGLRAAARIARGINPNT